MPILNDIMDHQVFGPMLRKARAEGRAEEGREIVLRQIEKRFGRLPEWAATQLGTLSPGKIERVALRLLDASSIEELLGPRSKRTRVLSRSRS